MAWLILLILALGITGCGVHTLDVDIAQERLDTASPPLDGSHIIRQSFVCCHPNLCEVELLPAISGAAGQGRLTLRLYSSAGHVVATSVTSTTFSTTETTATNPQGASEPLAQMSIDVARISHNVPLRFTFAPQNDSAGKAYEIWLEGTPGARVGFWYNSVDAYGGGRMELDHASNAGDLHFITRCRYDLPVLIHQVGEGLLRNIRVIPPLALLLLLPGYVLWYGMSLAKDKDPVSNLALSLGISLALLPTVLLWSTVFALQWGRSLCQVIFAGLALYACVRVLRRSSVVQRRSARRTEAAAWFAGSKRWAILAAVALFVFTLLLRFVQIRNLVLPAWVDSPQHALITQLVATQGRVPSSYEPLLPVKNFIYHFGFHADAAAFHWLSGLAIPEAMLVLGQVLNALSALAAYLLALRLTGRRLAAVIAMLIVGLVSYMPAYYVSWGRYTQLAGLVLLPAALVTAMDWLEAGQREYRLLCVAGLMQAGLFLTHARVTIYGACFLIVYWIYESLARLRRGDRRRAFELGVRSGLLGLLAVGLSAPWLVRVATAIVASLRATGGTLSSDPAYNAFPIGLLLVPHNRELMALAAAGAIGGLLQRRKETVMTLAWIVLVALILNPGWLGLPATSLVNNATAVISLFLPLSVLGGQAFSLAWEQGVPAFAALLKRPDVQHSVATAIRATLLMLLIGIALWSAWSMTSIINPVTVLATAEDIEAMTWIKENTMPDAVFLINARHWQLGAYVGTDGGYWIPQLTGRRVLLPALSYTYGTSDYVLHIAEMARVISEVKDADDPQLQDILEQENVTHVYIGAKGGSLTPQMFLHSSRYRPVYSSGAVWIFAVTK